MLRRLAVASALAALALPVATAHATDPASTFDAPGQAHANVCVHLNGATADLRFGDGIATGFEVRNDFSFYDGECPDGTVRLDDHEALPSSLGPLVFHRGGNGYNDAENVKYGELASSDIADALPPPVPSSGGRGAPCTVSADGPYQAQVRSIPDQMKYKRPQDVPSGSNAGASLMHYGDPGADQGDVHSIHYSYLVWSFVDVHGGGMVRTLLRPGQLVRTCDVDPITMDSWDSAGNVNGQVTARYVKAFAGTCPVYGWMVWTHTYFPSSATPVAHAVPYAGTPPADPSPDPGCPNAAPAAPPAVATGDAVVGATGAATLTGSVNPEGVPTAYHFDYGVDQAYGPSTAPGGLGAALSDVPVSAPVGGLVPGATYHYRLVATTTEGTSYGGDRTFVAPLAPPPPAPVKAAAVIAKLRSLKLAPSSFRRSRSARKATAHIRFVVNVRGTLTLTFMRKVTRHGRTHWVRTHALLRERTSPGTNSFAFGGWIGRHRLAPGRYKLIAAPADANGVPGPRTAAYFTLR